jgi:hydrogenase 3 maturation protease
MNFPGWGRTSRLGTTRELRNLIERAVILTEGSSLRLELPAETLLEAATPLSLDEAERRHVVQTLNRSGWRAASKGGAAEILGLKRNTLEARMNKSGIKRRPKWSQYIGTKDNILAISSNKASSPSTSSYKNSFINQSLPRSSPWLLQPGTNVAVGFVMTRTKLRLKLEPDNDHKSLVQNLSTRSAMSEQVILTVGNSMMGDAAAGPLLAALLQRSSAPGWQVIDGGFAPENVVHRVRAVAPRLVVVFDAVEMGLEPSQVRLVDERLISRQTIMTTHDLPVSFLMAALRETVRDVRLLGVQP